jgi:methylmalonyl-CoA mutase C-terminal domain/subunit
VDAVALSILSGAHMTLFPRILDLLRERGAGDILVAGGGVIPDDDAAELKKLGVKEIFGPGTSIDSVVQFFRRELGAKAR